MRIWPFNVIADKIAEGRRQHEEIVMKSIERIERVNALPLDEARTIALTLVKTSEQVYFEPAVEATPLPENMPDTLKEFFSSYRNITIDGEWGQLDLALWGVSEDLGEPYYVTGESMEGEALYCNCDPGELGHCDFGKRTITHSFASVFHWLIYKLEFEVEE